MNREEKIAAIYEAMANKELTFGCKIFCKGDEYDKDRVGLYIRDCGDIVPHSILFHNDDGWEILNKKLKNFEVIGHPVMIGDVIYWIRKKRWNNHSWFHNDRSKLVDLRSKEREPIEGQYDECIDFVHSLIPKS